MAGALILILQATAAPSTPPAAEALPDVEIVAHVTAREVRVQQDGRAILDVHASPDAGSEVATRRNPPAQRQRVIRNLDIAVRGEARIATPQQAGSSVPESPSNTSGE